jgi:integrase
MASPDAVSIVRELGIRESGESGSLALLGPGGHAAPYRSRCANTGHHEANRLAYFRHTYSTLLRSTGAELKIMQELLRHSTIRVTLDTYTQAVTTEKRNAQEAVVELLFPEKKQET